MNTTEQGIRQFYPVCHNYGGAILGRRSFEYGGSMLSPYIFKKGDLIGVNEKDHIYGYLIAQVKD